MENTDLYVRARAFLNSDRTDLNELAYLNGQITGIFYECTNCNLKTMLYAVERYVNVQTKKIEPMKISKYRFKPQFATSEVIIHGATTRSISVKNLTDEAAEVLIKTNNSHVLELNPDYVEEVPAPAPVESAPANESLATSGPEPVTDPSAPVTEPVAAPANEPVVVPAPAKKKKVSKAKSK